MTLSAKKIVYIAAAVTAAVLLVVYACFDPAESDYFPQCAMKRLTGWECPGCGIQRALHALLHGRVSEAFAYNPFAFLALPYVAAIAITDNRRMQRAHTVLTSPAACYGYVAAYLAWWVLRNII